MNIQLQELLKKAQYYTPSKSVTLAAGKETTITFAGLNSNNFGLNRILTGGTEAALHDVTATIAFNNGREKKFEEVSLATLRQLFVARTLRGAIVIDEGTQLFVTLKNNGSTGHSVNIELIGYDSEHLRCKKESYAANNRKFPEPEFIYVSEKIVAGAGQQRLSVPLPAYPLNLYRMAMTSPGEENIRLSIRQESTRIKPEVFLPQLNDEFRDKDIILPIELKARTPFDLFVSNSDNVDHTVSFMAECYRI